MSPLNLTAMGDCPRLTQNRRVGKDEGRSEELRAFVFALVLHACLFVLLYAAEQLSPDPKTRTHGPTTLALIVDNETSVPMAPELASEERHRNDASTTLDLQSPPALSPAPPAPSDLPPPTAASIPAAKIEDVTGVATQSPPAEAPLALDETGGAVQSESLSPLQLERQQQLRDLSARGAAVPQDHDLVEDYTSALQEALLQMLDPKALPFGARCRIRLHQERGGKLAQIELLPGCNLDTATKTRIERLAGGHNSLPYAGFETVFSESVELDLRNPKND
ncbi:hypothetical protein [Lysobacter enzymogenes]|uniref:hypothetical protein n=1 Tax=Lysobacter enzymogenes TaxID=69 RepID=UPI001AF97E62|nr:hypothetical protein [Lysobacter enzymogenes]QQQ00960.1 hypothetical protein JHW41_23315 [Lysobacter enzymogenes]